MKKINSYLIVVLVSFLLIGSSTTFVYGNKATNISTNGIIRNKPNFESEITHNIPIGRTVDIIEQNQEWYLIEYEEDSNKIKGWIYEALLINESSNEKINIGIVNTNVLNVRRGPSLSHHVFSRLLKDQEVTIVDKKDEWYHVILKSGVKGWVHGDFVNRNTTYNYPEGQVITDIELKLENSEDSEGIFNIVKGTSIFIKDYNDGWYNIIFGENEGWVETKFVELNIDILNPVNRSGKRVSTLGNIESITRKYIGTPYRYGGTGTTGFDCSGFVTYIFNQYYGDYLENKQIQLPRRSRDMANIGANVSKSQLRSGDLVFFNSGNNTAINHVGIYIGDSNFIHSAYSNRRGIVISSLNQSIYIRTFVKGIRL